MLGGPFVALAAGQSRSMALRSDGSVFTWGVFGQFGVNPFPLPPDFRDTPALVGSLPAGIRAIAAGEIGHSLALAPDGRVWAWGENAYGQVGDGTTVFRPTPVPISGLQLN